MNLEDVYRLQVLLPNIDKDTIISSLASNNNQAFKTLHDFMLKDITDVRTEVRTMDQETTYNADYRCIRHFLPNMSEARVKAVLDTIGTVPNRRYLAMKIIVFLLDGEENKIQEEVSNVAPEVDQVSSVAQITPVIEQGEELNNGDILIPLKLTLKRGKNGDNNSNDDWTINPLTRQDHSPIKKPKLENSALAHAGPSNMPDVASFVEEITNEVPTNIIDQPIARTETVVSTPAGPFDTFRESNLEDILLRDDDLRQLFQAIENMDTAMPKTMPIANPVASTSTRPILAPPKLFRPSPRELARVDIVNRKKSPVPSTSKQKSSSPVPTTSSHVPGCDNRPVQKYEDEQLVNKVKEMFPQVLPEYISKVCAGRLFDPQTFDEVVDIILSGDCPLRPQKEASPEREPDPKEQLLVLQSLLPDADPNYLKLQIEQIGMDQEKLGMFVDQAIVKKEYPTKKDSEIKQQLSAQQSQYTTDFNVDRFLEIFPDPKSVFEDANRKATANLGSTVDKAYILYVIRMIFSDLYANDLHKQLGKVSIGTCNMFNLVTSIEAFRTNATRKIIKKITVDTRYRPLCPNIPLLQECAYFEHKTEILNRLEAKKQQLAEERANAKELGLLETCGCCFDDEVMPEDILTCPSGCRFCRECIRRSTEVAFGDGKIDIICFTTDCNKEFSLQVLQNVLTPKMFSKLAQKKALAEVKAAGIEDLETCPFCDFANIPAPGDKIFGCLNPDCMKESCRTCKEPSHLPLRCDEVEKDEDVKNRVYIENKMTEALIRQCYRCSAKFIKEEGCNKMTCSCGAIMCYICRQPVLDGYKHFNGQGGDRPDLCPLYTDNFSVNEKNVLEAAQEAKKEIDPKKLKHDPTADLEDHFKDKIKEHKRKKAHIEANIPAHAMVVMQHPAHANPIHLQVPHRHYRDPVAHQRRLHVHHMVAHQRHEPNHHHAAAPEPHPRPHIQPYAVPHNGMPEFGHVQNRLNEFRVTIDRQRRILDELREPRE